MENKTKIITTKTIETIILITLVVFSTFFVENSAIGIAIIFLSFLLIKNPEYLFPPLMIAALMNEDAFIIGGITASRYFTLLVIFIGFFHMLFQKKKLITGGTFIYLIVLGLYIFFSALLSDSGITDGLMAMVLNIALVVVMSGLRFKNLSSVILCMAIGGAELLICILNSYFNTTANTYFGFYQLIEGTNNNLLGITLAQIGALFIGLFFFRLNSFSVGQAKKRYIFLIPVVLASFLLFVSGSRSASFGLVVSIIISFVYDMNRKSGIGGKSIAYLLIIVFLYLVVGYLLENNPLLAKRFTLEQIQETGGTGRFQIWSCVWNNIVLNYPVFGIGFGGLNVAKVLYENGIYHSGTHNLLLDMLAQLGILGCLYLVFGLLWLLKRTIKQCSNVPQMIFPLLMLVTAIGNGVGENIYTARFFWIDIGLLLWASLGSRVRYLEYQNKN